MNPTAHCPYPFRLLARDRREAPVGEQVNLDYGNHSEPEESPSSVTTLRARPMTGEEFSVSE